MDNYSDFSSDSIAAAMEDIVTKMQEICPDTDVLNIVFAIAIHKMMEVNCMQEPKHV
jgi:hypothetical protein